MAAAGTPGNTAAVTCYTDPAADLESVEGPQKSARNRQRARMGALPDTRLNDGDLKMATNEWQDKCDQCKKNVGEDQLICDETGFARCKQCDEFSAKGHDPDQLNDARADWAQDAIDTFVSVTASDAEDVLAELLADLKHWADRNGTDFYAELLRAEMHYDAETSAEG